MVITDRQHVAAGTFRVETRKPLILYACLGTCVGVALYDSHARIGGLAHIILPSPPSIHSTYQLEIYAETGFPLFVKALLDRGAQRENLEACIAGGALVGPVSLQDISLDIGGRTADIVKTLLSKDGIRVKSSETGGFFSCTLTLNLDSFETAIAPAQAIPPTGQLKLQRPTSREIKAVVENLQPIPQVALKIMRLLSDGHYDITAIASEIRQEQVIVGKILKLCNSSLFAGNAQVASLNSAILLLGHGLLIKTVVSAAVESFYNQSDSGYSLCKGGLYHHAVGAAVIAEKIAAVTGKAAPSVAYTAGLLHDIGMVVLDQYVAPASPLFYRALDKEHSDMLAVEKELLGINHCEAGKYLADLWELPSSLADAIHYHHFPEETAGDAALPCIIYLADLIMSRFHTGLEIERLDTDKLSARMKLLGLSPTALSDLVGLMPIEVFGPSPELAIARL
jgi:HD-like signal output (HDOD) protein/chemotaxis receptor (MCP) glutamine deamidase CheD